MEKGSRADCSYTETEGAGIERRHPPIVENFPAFRNDGAIKKGRRPDGLRPLRLSKLIRLEVPSRVSYRS